MYEVLTYLEDHRSDPFCFLGLLDWAGDDGASDNLPVA